MRRPGSTSSCVAGNVFIGDGCFEIDASEIKSLMSGTYITIKKANCQVLTLNGVLEINSNIF